MARGASVINGGSLFGILCGIRDLPAPRLKKVLTRDFWVRHRWRAQKSRVSTFFNTGEKFRKIFRSLYVHRLGKNNEAVNEAVSVPRVSLAKPLISGAKP